MDLAPSRDVLVALGLADLAADYKYATCSRNKNKPATESEYASVAANFLHDTGGRAANWHLRHLRICCDRRGWSRRWRRCWRYDTIVGNEIRVISHRVTLASNAINRLIEVRAISGRARGDVEYPETRSLRAIFEDNGCCCSRCRRQS